MHYYALETLQQSKRQQRRAVVEDIRLNNQTRKLITAFVRKTYISRTQNIPDMLKISYFSAATDISIAVASNVFVGLLFPVLFSRYGKAVALYFGLYSHIF